MRIITFLFCLAALLSLTACQPGDDTDGLMLIVDFDTQMPVKYKMVSERTSGVVLDSSGKMKPEIVTEKLEMVISYKPLGQPDSYGQVTVEATCHLAKVTRKARVSPPKDIVESLSGRSYTFKVTPTGEIVDHTNLNKLAAELGEKTISDSGKQGRIKAPDMINDFVTMQWFLWDSIATCDQATTGLAPETSWKSKQYIPLPFPRGFLRETTYAIAPEQYSALPDGQGYTLQDGLEKIVINSTYSVGEGKLENWPKIYTGNFGMKGTFGILRNYRLKSIEGTGKQTFNIERGLLEKDLQQYKVKVSAGFMFPLAGVSPEVTVDQKISIELLAN